MANHGYPWLTLTHKKSSSNDWAPSLIPRKATHLKRQLHLHGMPVEFYPKVLVDTSNPWYNWTILRKASSSCLVQLSFSAIAMAIAFSRRKLILWANHLCFSNCNASPTDNFLFFKRNAIVSLWLSQKAWAQVPIHDKHMLNCFFFLNLSEKMSIQSTFSKNIYAEQFLSTKNCKRSWLKTGVKLIG